MLMSCQCENLKIKNFQNSVLPHHWDNVYYQICWTSDVGSTLAPQLITIFLYTNVKCIFRLLKYLLHSILWF